MTAVKLPKEVDERLARLARRTGRTKAHYVRTALAEWLEENEDYLLALDRLEKDKERFTLEQLEREFGVER